MEQWEVHTKAGTTTHASLQEALEALAAQPETPAHIVRVTRQTYAVFGLPGAQKWPVPLAQFQKARP